MPVSRSSVTAFALFVSGTILIAFSSTFGLIAAFQYDIATVYISLAGFLIGYKMAQTGMHDGEISIALQPIVRRIRTARPVDTLSILGGAGFMGLGFTLLAQGILTQKILLTLTAPIVMGAGYILAHWGLNNRLV